MYASSDVDESTYLELPFTCGLGGRLEQRANSVFERFLLAVVLKTLELMRLITLHVGHKSCIYV
jgi:hypothetical protein